MKKNLFITIYSGLILLLCSCSKKANTSDQPILPEPLFITGRVIEYGSGLPIANVHFHYSICGSASCSGDGTTNADGLITIPESSINIVPSSGSYSFTKDGYWPNAKQKFILRGEDLPPVSFSPPTNGLEKYDSFQVRLFPEVKIKVHFKDSTITAGDTEFFFQCQANVLAGSLPRFGFPVTLARGIDTTFEDTGFGNTENYLSIAKINGASTDTVFFHTQFIAKGDSMNLEIVY